VLGRMASVLVILGAALALSGCSMRVKEIVDPIEAAQDPDFLVQGEYLGDGVWPVGAEPGSVKIGAQVIALGRGQFQAVLYKGGLPGEPWQRGEPRLALEGGRHGPDVTLTGHDPAAQAGAAIVATAKIAADRLTILDGQGKPAGRLARIQRRSPTLDAKPPAGAMVLFEGGGYQGFPGGHLTRDKKHLMGSATSRPLPLNYTLHLEFRLSYMPNARGQARSNSGVYLHDCYEVQILDSFGLEGREDEGGGIYGLSGPAVNMCLPPLEWQTYDIDFTAPKYEGDRKSANARITVRHHGTVIHRGVELPGATPGRQAESPGPRPRYLQGHGCRVQYRNIWLVPAP